MTKNNIQINYWVLLSLFGIIFITATTGIVLNVLTNAKVNAKITEQKESARPANLVATVIADAACPDCFDAAKVLANLEKLNVKIIKKDFFDRTASAAAELIQKYQIKKLPAFVLTGEIDKGNELKAALAKIGAVKDGAFVFEPTGGPYVLADTGEVKGRTNLLLITDATCTQCYDVAQHELILGQFGITANSKVVDYKSAEGKNAVAKYGVKLIPTFVLTGDIKEFPRLQSIWKEVGTVAWDGALVFRKGVPFMGTYKDLATGKIVDPRQTAAAAKH